MPNSPGAAAPGKEEFICQITTISIRTKKYIERLPGRVITHQCWPPMTNHR